MKASFVTIFLSALISVSAFGHGMNKAGPNGGYVRMPGNYHVELVSDHKGVKIYFLDMSFIPISIKNAQASLSLTGDKTFKTDCVRDVLFFKCDLKKELLKDYKEVILETSRDGKAVATSTYKLPLTLM